MPVCILKFPPYLQRWEVPTRDQTTRSARSTPTGCQKQQCRSAATCRAAHVTSHRLRFRSEHSALDLSLQTVTSVKRGTPCREAHVTSYRLCFRSEHFTLDLSLQTVKRGTPCRAAHVTSYRLCFHSEHSAFVLSWQTVKRGTLMEQGWIENLLIHKKSFEVVVQTFSHV